MCEKIGIAITDESLFPTERDAFGTYEFLGIWKNAGKPIYYKAHESGKNGPYFLFYGTHAWFASVICCIYNNTCCLVTKRMAENPKKFRFPF